MMDEQALFRIARELDPTTEEPPPPSKKDPPSKARIRLFEQAIHERRPPGVPPLACHVIQDAMIKRGISCWRLSVMTGIRRPMINNIVFGQRGPEGYEAKLEYALRMPPGRLHRVQQRLLLQAFHLRFSSIDTERVWAERFLRSEKLRSRRRPK